MSAVTTVRLPLGAGQVSVNIPSANLIGVYPPAEPPAPADEMALVAAALAQPISSPPLRQLARAGQRVVIVISDLTRPCPSARLLPAVLAELAAAGIAERDVTIVVALGLHRPLSEVELEALAGPEVYRRVRVINHNPRDTFRLGVTARGTPVEIFRPVVEADLRVCLGNLEFHYFVGYSGGAKAIIPGCASEATVTANHAMMVRPAAAAGRLEGNPVRADLEEAAAMLGVDLILNVLVDGAHRIVGAVAGDVQAAHRRGCAMVAARGLVAIPELADIALVGAGGYPKDINLYQAQKALTHAAMLTRDGGVVILVAACPEGSGSQGYETLMTQSSSPAEALAKFDRVDFHVGPHKAFQFARELVRIQVILVSQMPDALVRRLHLIPASSTDEALKLVGEMLPPAPRTAIMPRAINTIPLLPAR